MLRSAGIEPPPSTYLPPAPDYDKLAARGEFADSVAAPAAFVAREAERCLKCDSACLRCVEVCPNRANFALPIRAELSPADGLSQAIQILHVDELCNECGNCGVFCPYEGEPYRGKPTLFADKAALDASKNAGILFMVSAPGPSSKPGLIIRESPGEASRSLDFDEWSRPGSGGPMSALAREVHKSHSYLIGGSR